MRNYRLRERREKLGVSQEIIGHLASFPARNAQSYVSVVERGLCKNPKRYDAVRRALVWLESEGRRVREWKRLDDVEARAALVAAFNTHYAVVVDRLVDLLLEGRGEEFDDLAKIVPEAIAMHAGDLYLDACHPLLPAD